MKLAAIAITKEGARLAGEIAEYLDSSLEVYLPQKLANELKGREGVTFYSGSLRGLIKEIFNSYEGLIFIMALGIVVRMVAELLEDKRYDPAVVTINETNDFVISTLSGHLGGANELTQHLAGLLGAQPVITTATDSQGKLAIDMLAKELDCLIEPFANLKLINGALVNGETINIYSEYELELEAEDDFNLYPVSSLAEATAPAVIISNQSFSLPSNLADQAYLCLRPRNLVIGIGCRKGISKERIAEAVELALERVGADLEQVKCLATVDLKAQEVGLVTYAQEQDLELKIISREEIKNTDLEYSTSEFVKKAIGVGGVCEPVALLSGEQMELLLKKTKVQGVTVAVAQEKSL
ncbi:cobalt-precorrin 5A hydrolase [Fuchsiella alkaliacetigena]|uniref:cobalt-precorrin 5A hydrolase n=1 Tax=Fuchsiella alkaliacetigena TaxID=957042 RepID=UPI002009DDC0|nr:cobalt-precorrin 5A hydrolase [Fuchsiella alkaliacetigena]MCK8825524.1 cobalt-precorrin 5A hydrolase [Fuchsiella alkaliacetigena]